MGINVSEINIYFVIIAAVVAAGGAALIPLLRSSCRDSSEYKLSGGSNCGGINDWGGCAEYC